MDWTYARQAQSEFGDHGPWIRHLTLAWHACAVPDVTVPLPADPTDAYVEADLSGSNDELSARLRHDVIAYWSPLLHLLTFGLGWTRPDLGLARWLERGAPAEDPILNVVNRWWGSERISDFVAWTIVTPAVLEFGRRVAHVGAYRRFNEDPVADSPGFAALRRQPTWQRIWNGGDPLHTVDHSAAPMTYSAEGQHFDPVPHFPQQVDPADASVTPRMAVLTNTYAGWHALLWHYRPGRAANGRSIRTDIVCTPVGWMGAYRHSDDTGAWFRGRHRWHLLGN